VTGPASQQTSVGRWALYLFGAWFALLGATVLAVGVLRVIHGDRVFFYTEGAVFGSLRALLSSGFSGLYPADGWTLPPLVLTLYAPGYFLVSGGGMALTGVDESLLVPRVVSLVAFGAVFVVLGGCARRSRIGWPWTAGLLGALLLTPGVQNLVAAAQVDVLALAWTFAGLACLLAGGEASGPPGSVGFPAEAAQAPHRREHLRAVALLFFLLAFFTKQSYVAGLLAMVAVDLRAGRRSRALATLTGFVAVAGAGFLLLQALTEGGYARNTVDALTGSFGADNFVSTLKAGQPFTWIPLLLLCAAVAAAGRLHPLALTYAVIGWTLHLMAAFKTGSSANYFLEPTCAAVLVALTAAPTARRALQGRLRLLTGVGAVLLAVTTLPAVRELEALTVRMWRTQGPRFQIGGAVSGYPLVDVEGIPAVMRAGTEPFLNDPVAFGVLFDAGLWKERTLISALEAREVPFLLTFTDLSYGPNGPGIRASTAGVDLSYFWRIPGIWRAVTDHYEVRAQGTGKGKSFLWLPLGTAPPARR